MSKLFLGLLRGDPDLAEVSEDLRRKLAISVFSQNCKICKAERLAEQLSLIARSSAVP